MRDDAWRETDFSEFDTILHVAGIAHDINKKKDAQLYYRVNRDLSLETAQKAKASGVKQFIFISSMAIYNSIKVKNISANTPLKANDYYGNSKLQADEAMQALNSDEFSVAVLRPPMIFGKDCKGNFPRLINFAVKIPIFPKIKNRRSMLHIDNFCEITRLIIESNSQGIFFPQNPEYFATTDLCVQAASLKGKNLKTSRLFNWLVWLAYPLMPSLRKLFGNLTYDKEISNHFEGVYQIIDNTKSVEESI